MLKLKHLKTMEFLFEDVEVLNCKSMKQFENKIKRNEVIKIKNGDMIEYINSSYIMFFG